MKDTDYRTMSKRQAAAALEEFLTERPAALQRLRTELAADGLDPNAMLDGTPASLTPLWRWAGTRILEAEAQRSPAAPAAPAAPAPEWPSWARCSPGLDPATPVRIVSLLDGLVSYLGQVITTAAPQAVWKVGYHLQNHPVLTSPLTEMEYFPPGLVGVVANRLRHGVDPHNDARLHSYAQAVITMLRSEHEDALAAPEPLVEVDSDDDDGVFDVGLREDIAHEHSRAVDRMVAELAAQSGVDSAVREDREVLLVSAPDRAAEDLQQWVLAWLRRHIPAVD
ncbi:hypothetical protein GCM10011374_32210 [Kocuria dechangensis]|uniref:Uncharacterized protein n=1 Tax=Kocuria dechangensis TaxID=1176249 RepID=A0A917H322_9MICC|nr:hypothetical protein [Kocuria dechangensis]GGG65839.1 hypothetical protein GCM10011374_32210 [Kocuria dechangensis]